VRAFCAAGFAVTGLDISRVALAYARRGESWEAFRTHFLGDVEERPGGTCAFVEGDLFDSAVCPGPYDIVMCRNTIQYFQHDGRLEAALASLVRRLTPTGILLIGTYGAVPAFDVIDDWLSLNGFQLVRGGAAGPEAMFPKPPYRRVAWTLCSTG